MSSTSLSSNVSVLVITSDSVTADLIRTSLEPDYTVRCASEAELLGVEALALNAIEIALFVKPVMSEMDLRFISNLINQTPVPLLVFVDSDPNKIARAAIRSGVTSFVVDGLVAARVPTLVEVTMERFKLSEALRSELLKSQEELAARKVIERAKGLLMDKKQLNEQEAYRALRELAMRQSKPIKEVAETLLVYSDLLP